MWCGVWWGEKLAQGRIVKDEGGGPPLLFSFSLLQCSSLPPHLLPQSFPSFISPSLFPLSPSPLPLLPSILRPPASAFSLPLCPPVFPASPAQVWLSLALPNPPPPCLLVCMCVCARVRVCTRVHMHPTNPSLLAQDLPVSVHPLGTDDSQICISSPDLSP